MEWQKHLKNSLPSLIFLPSHLMSGFHFWLTGNGHLKKIKNLHASCVMQSLNSLPALKILTIKKPGVCIDKSVILSLAGCRWIEQAHNIIITGPTGVGKTYLACALAHMACRRGFPSFYLRCPRLFQQLLIARADGSYAKFMNKLAKAKVLVLDDLGLVPLTDAERRDLLEVLEDRYGGSSTIVTSQLPIDLWHDTIGDPTLADAILDRLVHNSYTIQLKGGSMRKHAHKTSKT